jgi:hypothetical protein
LGELRLLYAQLIDLSLAAVCLENAFTTEIRDPRQQQQQHCYYTIMTETPAYALGPHQMSLYSREIPSKYSSIPGLRLADTDNRSEEDNTVPVAADLNNNGAANHEPRDAGGTYLEPEKFGKAYGDFAEKFDDDGCHDVLFYKNILLRDTGDYHCHCPKGVVLVKSANGAMLWDAWIRKVPHQGHKIALTEFGRQLGNYATGMNYKLDPEIIAGGGHEEIDEVTLEDGDVHPERRVDPDMAIRVALKAGVSEPRIVIEVELSNRDPLPLAKHVHGLLLGWPNLRCAIGLKIYRRSEVGAAFACVCFVWKKRADNTIYVDRVFDMGPKKNLMISLEDVAEFWKNSNVDFNNVSVGDGNSFQVQELPSDLDYPLPKACPDALEDHFTVSISREDVYYGHTPTMKTERAPKKPKHLQEYSGNKPLEIDLYLVLRSIDEVETTNFK